jgi:hypothetical protein
MKMIVVRRMQRAAARGLYCARCSPPHWSWLGVKVNTCLAYKQKLGAGSCLPLPSAPAQSEMIVASINAECCPLVGRRNCARIRFQVIVYDVYDAKGG